MAFGESRGACWEDGVADPVLCFAFSYSFIANGPLPYPEWTIWDQTVEYRAFAYQQYIVISSLRPQYRYLGNVAIPHATSPVWHRRQLVMATPTTVEVVFVDAGVAPIDLETKRKKEEMKLKEAQANAVSEHGEIALSTDYC
ncbi:hypothetical protein Ancab_021463 [Ancistrocladus abbreviatus]